MLELYHHGSSVCAAKVRFALAEKGVDVDKSHYIDILAGEQFTDEYKKINPKAVVPSLVHDDKVLNESTVICEYLEETHPEPNLIGNSALERAEVRKWVRWIDLYRNLIR